ncbi:short-chain dehydrogenase [Oceanobacillus sp. CFH 90083]|uniref:short-chain dehydrogenase n=1 Tax=Oceanobacillus sp. CFH 90083 TaxID=2592336 RepID=UPI00128C9345|nr:short-chain dehydrogenase [Oceanobacillus sp. CFH 90083]
MQNNPWNPLSIEEINHLMKDIAISWWIAGGWALDLYYGKQTRKHDDMDILIRKTDLPVLKKHLGESYELFLADKGCLTKLTDSENLNIQAGSLWVRKKHETSWLFEIMLIDTENNEWVYKRNNQIKRPVSEIGAVTDDGIPYIKPEIQLLYKGGSSVVREKDNDDLERMLPVLKEAEVKWLYQALSQQFNGKHPWLEIINNKLKSFPAHTLVIGGTGMLSAASLWLADRSGKVSIIARNQGKMERLTAKADSTAPITPLLVDYKDSIALKDKIRPCIRKNGPVDLVVAWIHSNSNNALDSIAHEIAQESVSWKLYHVLGSSSDLSQIKEAAIKQYPGCQYRQIQLGFILEKGYSRWLTNQEISEGVIDAVAYDREVKVIGTLEPWDKRP